VTLATKITLVRILLVPFFVTQVIYYVSEGREAHRFAALAIFIAAALTDALDGYIARRYNQHSELGVFMDPLADKILLLSGVIVLSFDNTPFFEQLPLWMTATIISREAILVLGIGVIYYFCGKVAIAPRLLSKIATVLQMAVIFWVLLQWRSDWLEWLCIATAVTTGVAGILYIFDGIKQLGASPSSAATPRE
jgi:cardiolipin synthase (CMP-forming)